MVNALFIYEVKNYFDARLQRSSCENARFNAFVFKIRAVSGIQAFNCPEFSVDKYPFVRFEVTATYGGDQVSATTSHFSSCTFFSAFAVVQ